MRDFVLAALPWVICGLCVACLAAGVSRRHRLKKNTEAKSADVIIEQSNGEEEKNYQTEGMCIGMCLGVSFASLFDFDLSLGICFGMMIGMLIGMQIKACKKKSEKEMDDDRNE